MKVLDVPETNHMDIYSIKGTKVRFTGNGGFPKEVERAKSLLSIGAIYTVEETVVYDWSSVVVLQEHPNIYFNTCLFERV